MPLRSGLLAALGGGFVVDLAFDGEVIERHVAPAGGGLVHDAQQHALPDVLLRVPRHTPHDLAVAAGCAEHFLAARCAEKAMRDVRLNQIYEGTNQINYLAFIESFWEAEFEP